eukprot:TRINITY_DN77848_c0_g1_i1.p1 TRINITY_DN77848_c0_g1~~TRINITY_DN77848_c0_g1_i1.p1  ORF type:complete len:178 (-),score=24.17 TRINITY_DN77848_c0_g1_i1:65-526(-)
MTCCKSFFCVTFLVELPFLSMAMLELGSTSGSLDLEDSAFVLAASHNTGFMKNSTEGPPSARNSETVARPAESRGSRSSGAERAPELGTTTRFSPRKRSSAWRSESAEVVSLLEMKKAQEESKSESEASTELLTELQRMFPSMFEEISNYRRQ